MIIRARSCQVSSFHISFFADTRCTTNLSRPFTYNLSKFRSVQTFRRLLYIDNECYLLSRCFVISMDSTINKHGAVTVLSLPWEDQEVLDEIKAIHTWICLKSSPHQVFLWIYTFQPLHQSFSLTYHFFIATKDILQFSNSPSIWNGTMTLRLLLANIWSFSNRYTTSIQ